MIMSSHMACRILVGPPYWMGFLLLWGTGKSQGVRTNQSEILRRSGRAWAKRKEWCWKMGWQMWLTRIFPIRGGATWLYCVGLFCTSFYGSWLVFGLLYFFIACFHGDLEAGHLPRDGSDWIPCILEIDGFSSSFLYSLETQHTISYGGRQPTTQCPEAILTVSVQVKGWKKDVICRLYNTISLGSPWMSNSSLYG